MLLNAFIQAVAYAGTNAVPRLPDGRYQLDAQDITGPLDKLALEACRFVVRNMKVWTALGSGLVLRHRSTGCSPTTSWS